MSDELRQDLLLYAAAHDRGASDDPEGRLMTAEDEISAVLHDRAMAIATRDAERAVAHYADHVVSFLLAPPLSFADQQVWDPAWMEDWFQTWDGPIGYVITTPAIEAGAQIGFAHCLTHLTGRKTDGADVDLWFRYTFGLRHTPDGWKIVHEHESVPFYMDGSNRAATDLTP